MKINEALNELKKLDNELNKLFDKRAKIVSSSPKIYAEKMTLSEIHAEKAKFAELRNEKYYLVDDEVTICLGKITQLKAQIMAKNVELGLNKYIIDLKMTRIELSKLMELAKGERYSILSDNTDEVVEQLKIQERIKELEDYKAKIDAKLQAANWQNDL